MTKQEILEEIENKQAELEQEQDTLKKTDQELEFFQNFFKNNSIRKLDDILKINPCDFLIAHFKSRIPSMELEQIEKTINANKKLFINADLESFKEVIGIIKESYDKDLDLEIIVTDVNGNNITDNNSNKDIKSNNDNLESLDIETLVSLMEKDPDAFVDGIECMCGLKLISDKYNQCQQEMEVLENIIDRKLPTKMKNREINQYMKKSINFSHLDNYFTQIRKYYEKLNDETNSKRTKISRLKRVYEDFKHSFQQSLQQDEITNYNEMLRKLPDEEFRLKILEFINKHNQRYYQNLKNTHEKLIQNSEVKYHALLQSYGISKDEYCIGQIMKNNYDDVEYILKQLKNIEITDKKSIIKILQSSTKERVYNLTNLKESGILQTNFLVTNVSLFDETNDNYNTLIENLGILVDKRVNVFYLNNSQNSLLTDSQTLKDNMKTLEDYSFLPSMNNNTKYDFLGSEKLEEIIDNILELGYEEYLEQDLNLLNYDKSKYQRVRILKDLNIPISSKEELEEVLTTKKFIIPDEKLEEYIYNAVPSHLSVKINSLSQDKEQKSKLSSLTIFDDTKRTYNINGVIISKNKTERNLKKLSQIQMNPEDRLMVAIMSGSILNDEEYNSIKSAIKTKVDIKK